MLLEELKKGCGYSDIVAMADSAASTQKDASMALSPVDLSRLCEQNANAVSARSRTTVDCGPFRALLDLSTDMIWLNYAVPIGALDDAEAAAALGDLRQIFASHGRTPRFEFNALPWPALASLLERQGFQIQERHPLMICTPDCLRPFVAPGVAVGWLTADAPEAALAAAMSIQTESFGGTPEPPAHEQVERFREELRTGTLRFALATLGGAPAGAGSIAPIDGVAELGGIATSPALRRRGVAATLSSFLAAGLFREGGQLAWLSAGDAAAQAVYERVGFAVVDTRLNYIDPS
jgi:ribosomal protein S18 acetylase RimI-like enzyme